MLVAVPVIAATTDVHLDCPKRKLINDAVSAPADVFCCQDDDDDDDDVVVSLEIIKRACHATALSLRTHTACTCISPQR